MADRPKPKTQVQRGVRNDARKNGKAPKKHPKKQDVSGRTAEERAALRAERRKNQPRPVATVDESALARYEAEQVEKDRKAKAAMAARKRAKDQAAARAKSAKIIAKVKAAQK